MTLSASSTVSVKIDRLDAKAYKIPTDRPESDGTIKWDSTTIVVVQVYGGGEKGTGYSYTSAGAVSVIHAELAEAMSSLNAMDTGTCWIALARSIRNLGGNGIAKMAAAAVDMAIWDLKSRLLDLPLVSLLGACRTSIPVYGSGGFTSYSIQELKDQLAGWAADGIRMVKMKIGREPREDPGRIKAARNAIGPDVGLFVDANGAFDRKQALAMTGTLVEDGVTWYEQPVWHRDFEGLRLIRDRAPATIEISSGEYGFEIGYFQKLINAGTVDVLQADATRCGVTGFMQAGVLCAANYLPFSSHCAPAASIHLCCATERARHMEYFHDHVRIEEMLFDGVRKPAHGMLAPDFNRPGMGIELKEKDAERYRVIS